MFRNINEIIKANESAGLKFFEEGTMNFFGSKIYSKVYEGKYFITSEKDGPYRGSKRKFTIREAFADGSITSHGFCEHKTYKSAERALSKSPFNAKV